MSNWKGKVLEMYHDKPNEIGRSLARSLNIPWSSLWDFKKKIKSGEVSYEPTKPKILLFDIETAPVLAHVWSIWNNNVGLNQIMEDWHMLSWSAKWLGEDEVMYDALNQYPEAFEKDPTNDFHILSSLYDLLDEADIVIGHNGKKFDVKKAKARFLKWGFPPLNSFRVIDTLEIAKREFNLTSNRLDFLATYLDLPNKVTHSGHSLWVNCMNGVPEAWDKMIEYNKYDVVLLESVYLKIRAWSRNHPNVAMFYNDCKMRCNCCGSDDLEVITKTVKTNLSEYKQYRCNNCDKVSRDGVTIASKSKRDNLLRNVV